MVVGGHGGAGLLAGEDQSHPHRRGSAAWDWTFWQPLGVETNVKGTGGEKEQEQIT